MARGPSKIATADAVHKRLRRLKADSPLRIEAKALAKAGDTFGAMEALLANGDVTEAHVEAHAKWLDSIDNRAPEDFA